MAKKTIYGLMLLVLLGLIISFFLFVHIYTNTITATFEETLDIKLENVTEIRISHPSATSGEYATTTDKKAINAFIDYLDHVEYVRLSNDQSAYMPMRASMIYIYDGNHSNFIVPYENEAMINHKVYQIKNGKIENEFLSNFYHAIREPE